MIGQLTRARRLARSRGVEMPDDEHSANAAPTNVAQALAFFTREEAQTIEAAMGRILPADELGPGAVEAGALYYLDRALSGAEISLQGFYRLGLRKLNSVARERFGKSFAACTSVQQDDLIDAMARDALTSFGTAPTSSAFFEALRAHTIEGVFSDPVHGGNRNFWDGDCLDTPDRSRVILTRSSSSTLKLFAIGFSPRRTIRCHRKEGKS